MGRTCLPMVILLGVLLSIPGAAQAIPRGCSALAAEWGARDLWIVVGGQTPRRALSTERPIAAAAWSPDGRHIALSAYPPSSDSAAEVVLAEVGGRILGRFRVDRAQSEGGLRYINQLEWHGPRTLLTLGNAGPHGGYIDVWRLATDYSGAKKVRRALILGGMCAVSSSTQYAACSEGHAIMIFNTLVPVDEEGVADDQHYFVTPRDGEPDESLNTRVRWNDRRLALYAVRSVNEKRFVTTIERDSAAAEGWRATDRELVGIDAPVVSIEFDVHGTLLLGAGGRTYRVEEATGGTRAPVVAHVMSATETRRPGTIPAAPLEVVTDHGKLHLTVLDTYCPGAVAQQ